jgi:DNA invertase Pin-like site-specific DNA recombinase
MKEFQRMVQDAHRNHFQRIYCRRVDRFGRNLNEMIKTEIELHSIGMSLYFVEENIDTSTEIGRLVMNILSHVAEWKRVEILENTQRSYSEEDQFEKRYRYEEQGHDLGEYQRLCKRVSAYDSA